LPRNSNDDEYQEGGEGPDVAGPDQFAVSHDFPPLSSSSEVKSSVAVVSFFVVPGENFWGQMGVSLGLERYQ
jgi:hypothetical protein